MIPLNSTDSLESFLGGAGTDTFVVIYYDVTNNVKDDTSAYKRSRQITASNGATDVTICSAPQANYVRHVEEIYYRATGAVTVTIQYDFSGAETPFITQTLATNETLCYDRSGWHII